MLPYTPLHTLLFEEDLPPVVMTSGNPSDEPLCCDNHEALARLAGVADAFLLHDRDIERRIDDSVVVSGGKFTFPIRRARGYVPAPIAVQVQVKQNVLAVGGELKSTICLLTGSAAVLSEHLGELPHPVTYRNFLGTIQLFQQLLRQEADVLACDLHPSYITTRWARSAGLPVEAVQHHHAHVVSCMADNGISGHVIGIACDGTGYGTDGAVWGGEILVGDEAEFTRAAHLKYFSLVGGDAAALETWRPAAALLRGVPEANEPAVAQAFVNVDSQALSLALRGYPANPGCPRRAAWGACLMQRRSCWASRIAMGMRRRRPWRWRPRPRIHRRLNRCHLRFRQKQMARSYWMFDRR